MIFLEKKNKIYLIVRNNRCVIKYRFLNHVVSKSDLHVLDDVLDRSQYGELINSC